MFLQHQYRWAPDREAAVRQEFDRKAGTRLKDMHNSLTTKRRNICPPWMSKEVHTEMMENSAHDQFKQRSRKAAKNRRGGVEDLTSKAEASHCQGSVSSVERANKLAAKKGGVLPLADELYLDTHFREKPGQGLVPVSSKAQSVKDNLDRNIEECQSQGIQKDKNTIFLETVGGVKKGKIYGLGQGAGLYYETSSRSSRSSSATSPPTSVISQLSQRVEYFERENAELRRQHLELEARQREHEARERQRDEELEARQREHEARERQRDEELEQLKALVEAAGFMTPCSTYQQWPRPPPSGGAGGSGSVGLV